MPTSPSSDGVVKPATSVADVEELFRDDTPADKGDKGDKGDKDKGKGDKSDKGDKDKKSDDDNIDLNLDDEGDDEDKIDLDEDDKDDKKDKKADAKKSDDEDDEDEDEDKDDDEDEEKDDEELELSSPPRKKDITAKYPKFFKEFPWMERMLYRDRQYTELFGSFDDAKEAHTAAESLRTIDVELGKGDLKQILSTVKTHNTKAFDKIVDNYLPSLFQVDKDAYFEITGNIAKQIIKEVYQAGQGENSDDLKKLALDLNKFLFKSTTWTPPTARVADKDKEDDDEKVTKEREEFMRERYEVTVNDLQGRVDNILRNAILEHIDPKGEMSNYIKKNAGRDALTSLHKLIKKDTTFSKTIDRLWQASFNEKFNKASTDRIKSTYLGRAKKLLPVVIRKARAKALDGLTPSLRRNDDDEDTDSRSNGRERKDPVRTGRPRQQGGKSLQMERGESVLDFLSRD